MLNRRDLLRTAAAATPAVLMGRATAVAQERPSAAGMNVVLFISDQERAIQHFPTGWARENLPGFTRLQSHGLTFENAFTNACMCSPSRATMLTGYMPAQHGVKYTLEENMPNDQYPQVELPLDLANLATVMSAAGYDVVYKGKFHLVKPAGSTWSPEDVGQYGFTRWNPPDAGANQDVDQAGGGVTDNDGRYMDSVGDVESGTEGILQYLNGPAKTSERPFFLIVSLVNPHDVLMYPKNFEEAGYDASWYDGDIRLPATVDEDLSTKPTCQEDFIKLFALSGPLVTPRRQRRYLNFYGNLMKQADRYLVEILDTLQSNGMTDDTLVIRTSDHGEMGMTHGGMRQKVFNVYEETLRVPLVYSNPRLFPKARRSEQLVSHVDFLPTMAGLLGAPASARRAWAGVDYSGHILGTAKGSVQNDIVFTFDDFQCGQASPPYVPQPNHIISVRERRYKIARYYDPSGKERSQWEMYDLRKDPLERRNIAHPSTRRTPHEKQELRRLKRKLARVQRTQLKPLPQTLTAIG